MFKFSHNKSLKRKLSLIILSLILILPIFNTTKVKAAEAEAAYSTDAVLIHYHIKQDGSIEVSQEIDLLTHAKVNQLTLNLVHRAEQNIILDGLYVGEVEDQVGKSYVSAVKSDNNTDTVDAYTVNQDARSYQINLNTFFPENAHRRIVVRYRLFNTSLHYEDASLTYLDLLNEYNAEPINRIGVIYSFEAEIFANERSLFRAYEYNNLPQVNDVLRISNLERLKAFMNMPNETGLDIPFDNFCFLARDIAKDTNISVRLIYPSAWLSLSDINPLPEDTDSIRERVEEEEADHHYRLLQLYKFRDIAFVSTIVIFIVLALIFIILSIYTYFVKRVSSKTEVKIAPAYLPAEILAYLSELKLNGRALYTIIAKLNILGFINLDEDRIYRVKEVNLPSEDKLLAHEKIALHWIYQSLRGQDEISIDKLIQNMSEKTDNNLEQYLRLARAFDAYCKSNNWLETETKEKYNLPLILLGLILSLLSILMAYVADFLFPLLLLLPAITIIVYGFRRAKYSDLGKLVLRKTNSYASYLANISKEDREYDKADFLSEDVDIDIEELKEKFFKEYLFSLALEVNAQYLQDVKYILPLSFLAEHKFLSTLAFPNLESNVLEKYSAKEPANLREERQIYKKISKLNKTYIDDLQDALNSLELMYRFPTVTDNNEDLLENEE